MDKIVENFFNQKIEILGLKLSIVTLVICVFVIVYFFYYNRNDLIPKIEDEDEDVKINYHDTLNYRL
jgi:magnesium-transporting ATPase (P-type)